MKKIYYWAMSLTLAIMVGCQNENEDLNVQKVSNQTFTASFENNGSRTALQGENNDVVWVEGDKLSVFAGEDVNQPFVLKSGQGTNYGEFKFDELSAGTDTNGSSASALSANVAYYPYGQNVTVSEAGGAFTFNANFPSVQTFTESGTFGNGAAPMVAVTANTLQTKFMFKNVGGIFRLQLQGDATVTKVVFSAEGHDLAGMYQVTTTDNSTEQTLNVTEGSSAITLDCGEGVELSANEPTNFVVAMLPVSNVQGGLTITVYDKDGNKMTFNHTDAGAETFSLARSGAKSTELKTYEATGAAIVNETNLKAALDEAASGTEPAIIKVEGDISLEEPLSIESGKNVNLDLNGNTLTFTAGTPSARSTATVAGAGIHNGGSLSIENGTIIYTYGLHTPAGSDVAAVVNKGKLTLTNVIVESDIYCVKTLGAWTANTLEEHTGEPVVTTTITGGTYTSTGNYHSNGAHIYTIYAQDFAKTTIEGATIKGDGGVCVNTSILSLDNNKIEATDNSTFGMYIIGTGNITVADNNTFITKSGTPVVAYSGSNAKYGKIVYNGNVLNYADANTTLIVPAGVYVELANESAAPVLNGKVVNNGTLVIKAGTIKYAYGSHTSAGSEEAAVVNKGKLTLANVTVESDIYCVKTLGAWDANTLEEHTGEPVVTTTITGGTYTSTGNYHSNGAHIYAIYAQDFAKTTIAGATIKGDGGVCVNTSILSLDNNKIEATDNSTFGMYIIGTGNITVADNNTFITKSGTPVVAYSGSNAKYGKIVYNGNVLNYADANTTLIVPAGVHVVLAKESAAPILNGKVVNNGTLVIKSGEVNYAFEGTYNGWGSTFDETSAIVNKGLLTLEGTNVTSNVFAIKTFGTWTGDKKLAEQGEPIVKTIINGGTIKSKDAPHSTTGSHIYAMSSVDNALLAIDGNASIVGDGDIYVNCSKVNVGQASLTANCTTSANCIYIEDTGIVNTADNTTMNANAAKVVAFDDSNAKYGVITYNDTDVTFANGEKTKVLVE